MSALWWVSRTLGEVSLKPSWSVASLLSATNGARVLSKEELERLASLASLPAEAAFANENALGEIIQFCQRVADAPQPAVITADDVPPNAVSVNDLSIEPPAPVPGFNALAAAPKRQGQYFEMPKHSVL